MKPTCETTPARAWKHTHTQTRQRYLCIQTDMKRMTRHNTGVCVSVVSIHTHTQTKLDKTLTYTRYGDKLTDIYICV